MPERRKPESKNCSRARIGTSLGHHLQKCPESPLAREFEGASERRCLRIRCKNYIHSRGSTVWKFEGASCKRHLRIFRLDPLEIWRRKQDSSSFLEIETCSRLRTANSKAPLTGGAFEFAAKIGCIIKKKYSGKRRFGLLGLGLLDLGNGPSG